MRTRILTKIRTRLNMRTSMYVNENVIDGYLEIIKDKDFMKNEDKN